MRPLCLLEIVCSQGYSHRAGSAGCCHLGARMKTYHWFANRQPAGSGLRHFHGTTEARTVKEAWAAVDLVVAEHARQGLVKGEFKLSIRQRDRWFANRCVYIHPNLFREAIIHGK